MSLILEESTSLNQTSGLTVPNMETPKNIYVDLIELQDLTAEGIVCQLLSALERVGRNKDFLSKTLVGVTCDGASVMLGCRTGLATRLKAMFPGIIVWHCSAHRLELSVHDVVDEMGAVNHFNILMDKLYAMYSVSNKNRLELKECADSLDIQLCKTGRVLDTRWVASSLRSVEAVWKNFPALHKHFTVAAEDSSLDSKTQ